MANKWPRKGKEATARQKKYRDDKRAAGYVKLQAWVKLENKNQIKRFIKFIENE